MYFDDLTCFLAAIIYRMLITEMCTESMHVNYLFLLSTVKIEHEAIAKICMILLTNVHAILELNSNCWHHSHHKQPHIR